MINRVVLVGRVTKQPEFKHTSSNIPVATLTLAVNRTFSNSQGEKETDFIPCVIWRKQAENVNKYVNKGSLIGVEGRMQTRSYESNGSKRYITEVICDSVQFLESKKKEQPHNAADVYGLNKQDEQVKKNNMGISPDDLPF